MPAEVQLVVRLVGLRYRLLWAQMRTRNGKVAILTLGCVVFAVLLLFSLFGGYRAAAAAARAGQLEWIARSILGGLFLGATCLAVLSGLGIRDACTDAALRRYPLSCRGRLAARHITDLLEPLWILIFALEGGLAAGISAFGHSAWWQGSIAVPMLVLIHYLLARDLVCIAAGLARFRIGTMILVIAIPGVLLPGILFGPGILKDPTVLGVLRFSPPFSAAALPMGAGSGVLPDIGLLLLWALGLLGLLPRLETWSSTPAKPGKTIFTFVR